MNAAMFISQPQLQDLRKTHYFNGNICFYIFISRVVGLGPASGWVLQVTKTPKNCQKSLKNDRKSFSAYPKRQETPIYTIIQLSKFLESLFSDFLPIFSSFSLFLGGSGYLKYPTRSPTQPDDTAYKNIKINISVKIVCFS